MKRALEGLGFRILAAMVRGLPRSALAPLARGLARVAFDVLRIRRDVAVGNVLARLAPPGGRAEAERIARASYAVLARTFLDLVVLDRLDEESLWRIVSREEFRAFRDLARREEGGVFLSGHFGNWELMGLGIQRMGLTVRAVAADQATPVVDAHVKRTRGRAGVPTLSARHGLRQAVRTLRDGGYLATLADQDARGKGTFVDFLGAPAAAHTGIVSLAVRAGKPIIPGVLVDEGATYRLVLGEPWRADPALSDQENAIQGARSFHRFLEAQVRAHPENYFWAHRRWKTRPPAGERA